MHSIPLGSAKIEDESIADLPEEVLACLTSAESAGAAYRP